LNAYCGAPPADAAVARLSIPWEAAFLAGKAAVTGMTLLTRDPQRYRAYFPTLKIVAP